jgi:hypothetical protein
MCYVQFMNLHDRYYSPNIIRWSTEGTNDGRIMWHVRGKKKEMHKEFWGKNLKERDHLQDLGWEYSRIRFIRINWDDEPPGYAENKDNLIILKNRLHLQFEVEKKNSTNC